MSSWTPIDSVSYARAHRTLPPSGYYLRATATYDGEKRTAQAVSVNKVRAAPTTADAPWLPSSEPASDTRDVDENSPAGTNVGDPVKANDTTDDVLTYSLSGTQYDRRGAGQFRDKPCDRPDHGGSLGPFLMQTLIQLRDDLHRHGDG